MKIFDVEIENYRQYKGKIVVKLSVDDKKNLTIIQADNGVGKSNFMNAIIWCLYEDEMFKSEKNEGRGIVNELAIQELNLNDSIDVRVAVALGESNREYLFERKVSFTKQQNGYSVGSNIFTGYQINAEKGWVKMGDPAWFIDRHFIPKDLRGFFFFDGEKMNLYFEDTSKVKYNVEKIAQIDVLKSVIKTLSDVKKEITRDISKKSIDQSPQQQAIEELEGKIEENSAKKKMLEDELIELNLELSEIDEYLRNNSDNVVREIQKNIDDQEKLQKEKVGNLHDTEKRIRDFIAYHGPILLSLQALVQTKKYIDEETERGVLPPNIKDVFIKDLLSKGVCICGRNLREGDESRKNVENLLLDLMPSDISIDATNGKFFIDNMLSKKDFSNSYKALLSRRKTINDELLDISEKLRFNSERLKKYDVFTISEKEERRNQLKKEINQRNTRKGALGNAIVTNESYLQELYENNRKAANLQEAARQLQFQKDYAHKLESLFMDIEKSIVSEVRKQLEEKTKEYFFSMIWKKEAFSDVQIVDLGSRYKISVKTEYGNECLGDLSAGEQQTLALAFTAALYSVSGYSVPVMIDTPLARISEAPREKIARLLPGYLSDTQIIMLPTDAEYTESIREQMKECVGAEYSIAYDEETKTSMVVAYE